MKTQNQIEAQILKLTWTRRYSFEGLRKAVGLGHDEVVALALAIKSLMDQGKVRFWGNTGTNDGQETQYIVA